MPPITPPPRPTAASAMRPPQRNRGRLRAMSMVGHQHTSRAPKSALNQWAFKCGSRLTPTGTPTSPPSTNGHSRAALKPRRMVTAATTWPVSEPNTASAAAKRGSSTQAQNDMATMLKAKPDRPCTKPATTAPRTRTANVSMGVSRTARRLGHAAFIFIATSAFPSSAGAVFGFKLGCCDPQPGRTACLRPLPRPAQGSRCSRARRRRRRWSCPTH